MFRVVFILPALITSAYGLVSAVDSSTLVSVATYKKAFGEGFTKAIIRGYSEACGVGGEVDTNFVSSYNNAIAAGYTNIDTYMFPCNGSGNKCKSYATQIAELGAAFKAHNMKIGTIWIDLEKDAAVCNNVSLYIFLNMFFLACLLYLFSVIQWNYGAAGNQAQARSLIAAMKASGFNFGIYSSPGVCKFGCQSRVC